MSCVLNYTLTGITGDCSNLGVGSFGLTIEGSAPGYTIQWLTPITDIIPLGEGVTNYEVTDLTSGTYSFNIIDSCSDPVNNVAPVSVFISSGVCTSISNVINTVCDLNNGSLTATTQYDYGSNKFYLYHTTLGYISSGTTTNTISPPGAVFTDLSPGTYYVVVNDGGGCSGITNSVIVKESTQLDFGIYIVNDAGCNVNSGKLFITGLTGSPPYSYLWSNGEITDNIENLTSGGYNVTVSDSSGCVVNKTAMVSKVPTVGQAGVLVTQPSCFASDGTLTLFVSGGTAPYYYSGSNGTVSVQFANYFVFDNLPSGVFSYYVQDSGLCNFNGDTSLITPLTFTVVSVNQTNSKCNNSSGSISPLVTSGSPPYTFKLTSPNGSNNSVTTTLNSYEFVGLSSGVYTLSILDAGGCEYIRTYEIINEVLFNITPTLTGTTCGLNNGAVNVKISGGTGPFLLQVGGQSVQITTTGHTFQNLDNGSYVLDVTDTSVLCKQSTTIFINDSVGVDFTINSQNPVNGNDGRIELFITSGQPPFTYEWSPNVGSQTGMLVTGLGAGTYTVKVTDNNGCVNQKTKILLGMTCSVAYEVYNLSSENFVNTGELIKKGPHQMLTEGFYDLTLNEKNCILNNAVFDACVSVKGVSATTASFFVGETLNEYPSDSLWGTTIRNLLLSFDGIGGVVINNSTNKITISTDCESEVSLLDADISVYMVIHYDVSCVCCEEYVPTECEITAEYCETPDKVIYDIKIPFTGFDFLDNVNIIPTRCVQLANQIDCSAGGAEDLGVEFRQQRDSYVKYSNEYFLAMVTGQITLAESIPIVLPPSMDNPLNSFYQGPNNVGYLQMNVLQGCSCKRYYESEGLVGPQYDFDIVFLTEVQSYGDLPLTGEFGQRCMVVDEDMWYYWNPNSNNWTDDNTPIVGYPDQEDCASSQREKRNAYLKALNQLGLASRPFTWSNFYIPFYQIYKYKT